MPLVPIYVIQAKSLVLNLILTREKKIDFFGKLVLCEELLIVDSSKFNGTLDFEKSIKVYIWLQR